MSENELVKRSFRVYRDDLEIIQDHYSAIGYSKLVRHMLRRVANQIREQRAQDTHVEINLQD